MDVVEVGELHNRLARRFKEYEQTVGHLPPIEVLNELRYALRASIELLGTQAEDAELTSKLMARIEHALFCAYHDLVDGLVIEVPSVLDQLRLEFPVSAGQVAGTRFIEIMSHVKAARDVIATTRGDPQSRACGYEALYEEWFGKLLDDFAFPETGASRNRHTSPTVEPGGMAQVLAHHTVHARVGMARGTYLGVARAVATMVTFDRHAAASSVGDDDVIERAQVLTRRSM